MPRQSRPTDPLPHLPASRADDGGGTLASPAGVVVGLVEDDPVTATVVSAQLAEGGYGVRVYDSAHAFRRGLGFDSIDLLVLDWSLPDGTGVELLLQLRNDRGLDLPVIFLTGHDHPDDIVTGLDAGADDYIIKPARSGELLARVRSALRRRGPATKELTDVAPFSLDLRTRAVTRDGQLVELQGREFDLFVYLLRRAGRLVSRATLLTEVWNANPRVATRSVDTYVSRLRRRLGLNGESGWELTAVYQHGYRLARRAPEVSA